MEIIKLKIADVKPYEKNAKRHPQEQIEQIKKSIEKFGMNDPIAIWGKENIIVEGHGRLEALKELGYDEVECIRLDHLSDEERRAYTLAHNKLTMNSDFDLNILEDELENLKELDFDLELTGFANFEIDSLLAEESINWENVDDLENYEEPTHKMLECPNCHHIDRDIHFKKIQGVTEEEIKTDND